MRYSWALWFPILALLGAGGLVAAPGVYTVEVDLDGVTGNGPDTIEVAVGDSVEANIWLDGPEPLLAFGVTFCNLDGVLEYHGKTANLPDGWVVTPGWPPIGCDEFTGLANGGAPPMPLPWRVGSVRYRADVDQAIGSILVDSVTSGYNDILGGSALFDALVEASVRVGATATEPRAWGAVKSLFR